MSALVKAAHPTDCCLKKTGLKISPSVLGLSRFLEPLWHTLAKCLSRQCRASQYWWGRLGVLATRRSSWAHSSGFATSGEGKKVERWKGQRKKQTEPFFFVFFFRLRGTKRCGKTRHVQQSLANRTDTPCLTERTARWQVIGCSEMLKINPQACFSSY